MGVHAEIVRDEDKRQVLASARTIAVLGAHPTASRAASYVPAYLRAQGYRVIPVNPRFAGSELFDETVRVPMLLRLPGVAPRRVAALASLLDVVPTLAHYLGLPDEPTWQGVDWLTAAPADAARVVSQVEPVDNWGGTGLPAMQLVHDGRFTLVVDVDGNLESLFDLETDPGQTRDLVAVEPARVAALRRVWATFMDQPGCRAR